MMGTGKGKGGGVAPRAPLLHEDRLRRALGLGLRASSSSSAAHYDGRKKSWCSTDAELQGQAVRAIQAFISAHKANLHALDRTLLDDIISALEGLLMAGTEQVYHRAAEITLVLLTANVNLILGFGARRLVLPLVHLLLCPKSSTVVVCATGLQIIIETSKPRTGITEDELFKLFKEFDVPITLASKLQKHDKLDGDGTLLYVAIADLLTACFRRWTILRFDVGCKSNLHKSVLLETSSANENVSCAALRLSSALALCGGAALCLVQEKEGLWFSLMSNTDPSKAYTVRIEALRFITSLSRLPAFSLSVSISCLDTICRNITNAIAEGLHICNARRSRDLNLLVLEASQAAHGIVKVAGNHHMLFCRAGLAGVLCSLLMELYDFGGLSGKHNTEVNRKTLKSDRTLAPCLWDIFGWLAIHAQTSTEESLTSSKQQETSITRIVNFACATLLKIVDRRGFQVETQSSLNLTGLEGIRICKSVLFLLSSTSTYLAGVAKRCLENALCEHGYDWLPSFICKLSLPFSSAAASENMTTIMHIIALCSLSSSTHCHQQLVQQGVLQVLSKALKAHPSTTHLPQINLGTCIPSDVSICCWTDSNPWEGDDPILFFSLWAFASLARRSDTAKALNLALKKRLSEPMDWDSSPDEDLEHRFLVLASSTTAAAGVRQLAACCLACCGVYGFPSARNNMLKLFNDSLSADIRMVFADGSHIYAHKVIIITKCPNLLPSNLKDGACLHGEQSMTPNGSTNTCPVEVRFGSRVNKAPVVALLEFLYKGFVLLEESLVLEVKLIAKQCHMDILSRLLQGKIPAWGSFYDTYDFSPALGNKGCKFADILLEDKDRSQAGCILSAEDQKHLHAHRPMLSTRCSYFEAFFRSGMQDSVSKIVKIPLGLEALRAFLHYLYSITLPQIQLPEAGCMWDFSDKEEQIKHLKSYVELAQIADQWVLPDLKEQCLSIIQSRLENSLHLGPEVMKFAALYQQWELVELVAQCISADYIRMRDNGELDLLDDYMVDAVRTAHVQSSMASR